MVCGLCSKVCGWFVGGNLVSLGFGGWLVLLLLGFLGVWGLWVGLTMLEFGGFLLVALETAVRETGLIVSSMVRFWLG